MSVLTPVLLRFCLHAAAVPAPSVSSAAFAAAVAAAAVAAAAVAAVAAGALACKKCVGVANVLTLVAV
jgi:hypothetical protein